MFQDPGCHITVSRYVSSWLWQTQMFSVFDNLESFEELMFRHFIYTCVYIHEFSSVQSLSRVRLFATQWTAAHQASLSITNSWSLPKPMSLSQWCHPTISSSVILFSSCLQSFPIAGTFQMSQLFASGGQNIDVSASASVLPMNTQDWSPLGWTGWISLQSKGLSRVFSNTTVQKHQFFCTQLSL